MMILLFFLITSTFCCEPCKEGPIKMETNFSVMGTQLEVLYIEADRLFINNKSKIIKFFDINSSKCIFFKQQLSSSTSLRYLSGFVHSIDREWSSYQAEWGYTIVFDGFCNNTCRISNYYQITLISNQQASFILIQYYNSDLDYYFNFGIDFPFFKRFFYTNHSQLISESNIGLRGHWIYLVDNNNNNKALKNMFDFKLILLTLIFNKYLF